MVARDVRLHVLTVDPPVGAPVKWKVCLAHRDTGKAQKATDIGTTRAAVRSSIDVVTEVRFRWCLRLLVFFLLRLILWQKCEDDHQ